jgi:hypothetical protein
MFLSIFWIGIKRECGAVDCKRCSQQGFAGGAVIIDPDVVAGALLRALFMRTMAFSCMELNRISAPCNNILLIAHCIAHAEELESKNYRRASSGK